MLKQHTSFRGEHFKNHFKCFEMQRSGEVPGVGLSHSPIALLPGLFPGTHWNQACELSSIFNELVDRVSMDGKFLQESLSRYAWAHLKSAQTLVVDSFF